MRNLIEDVSLAAAGLNDRIDGKFFKSLCSGRVLYSHVSHLGQITPEMAAGKDTLLVRDGDIPFDDRLAAVFRPAF
jgi:hypothetical protein